MTAIFSVVGPFEVPVYSKNKGHLITADCGREFCEKNHEIADLRGCYVFALRVGGGTTPYYVGRATKTFRQEVFTPEKLMKYVRCITDNIGTPVPYMVAAERNSGVKNNQICDLEDFLIQNALAVNPDILNMRGKSALDWGIRGVFHGARKAVEECDSISPAYGYLPPENALSCESFGNESRGCCRGEAGRRMR
jgi:hypothetical protein